MTDEFFYDVESINKYVKVGMTPFGTAVAVKSDEGWQMQNITPAEAKLMAEYLRKLAFGS